MNSLMSMMLKITIDINTPFWPTFILITKWVMLGLTGLCGIFIICVVLFQPGSSSGLGALGGQTETFLSKNKGKTMDSKMKKYTVIAGILMAVFCISFYVLSQCQVV